MHNSLLDRIIARAETGYHAQSDKDLDIVPAWEADAIIILPALLILGACLADALRGAA